MSSIPLPLRTRGLTDDERDVFGQCLAMWRRKRRKNLSLNAYHDSKQLFKDLRISLPPSMRHVRAALGWPQKAVSALARKHQFEGFSAAGQLDPFDMNEILVRNEFETEFVQTIHSGYKHSVAFITSTAGDVSAGEPEVIYQARSAEDSGAIWDKRRRELAAYLAVVEVNEFGEATECILFLRHDVIELRKVGSTWNGHRLGNRTGRVLAEPFPYDPQLNRPFGRSRISREVRYLTDAAIRTMLRTEVSAEFYASPQRWVLGAKEDAFKDVDRWKAIMGRLLALELNEEGEKPELGQFAQLSMAPHLEMYRQQAQNFCSATGLPQSSVGLFAENPASAEAMQAAESALSDEGEYQWRIFRPRLIRLLQNGIMIRDKTTQIPAETWAVNVNWTPCRYISPQAASDWAVKVVGADESLKGSTVIQRRMGLSQGEIEEVRSERRVTQAQKVLERFLDTDSDEAAPNNDFAQ